MGAEVLLVMVHQTAHTHVKPTAPTEAFAIAIMVERLT